MPRELILAGPPTTIIQNIVYALPSRSVLITANGPLQFSMDGTNFTADVAASTTGIQSGYPFCRAVGGNVILTVKRG